MTAADLLELETRSVAGFEVWRAQRVFADGRLTITPEYRNEVGAAFALLDFWNAGPSCCSLERSAVERGSFSSTRSRPPRGGPRRSTPHGRARRASPKTWLHTRARKGVSDDGLARRVVCPPRNGALPEVAWLKRFAAFMNGGRGQYMVAAEVHPMVSKNVATVSVVAFAWLASVAATGCAAQAGTAADEPAAETASSDLTSASIVPAPAVATHVSATVRSELSAGSLVHGVYLQIDAPAVALPGSSFVSAPATAKLIAYEQLGPLTAASETKIVDTVAGVAHAVDGGIVIVAGADTFTVQGDHVRFSGSSRVPSGYPGTSDLVANVGGGSAESAALRLGIDALVTSERLDTSGYWQGRTRRLGTAGIELHCWARSNGDHDAGCEVALGDARIVGKRGSKLVFESSVTGTAAENLWNALPSAGTGVRGATGSTGYVACGHRSGVATCVARATER